MIGDEKRTCKYDHFYLASRFISLEQRSRCPVCPAATRQALGVFSTNMREVAIAAEGFRRALAAAADAAWEVAERLETFESAEGAERAGMAIEQIEHPAHG